MSYKSECVYYYVCIDKGCPCKLVYDTVVSDKVYKVLLEELEQEYAEHERSIIEYVAGGRLCIVTE